MITRSSSNSNNSCFSIGSLSVSHSILTVAGVIRRSSTTSIGLGKTGTRTTFAGRTRKSTLAMSQHLHIVYIAWNLYMVGKYTKSTAWFLFSGVPPCNYLFF